MKILYKKFIQEEDNQIQHGLSSANNDTDASISLKSICLQLGRPFHVVTQRAFQLGLIQYSDFNCFLLSHRQDGWRSDEVDVLFNNPLATRKQIAKALDRSVQSVNKKFVEFNLKVGGPTKPWVVSEKTLLRQNINNTPIRDICNALMRVAIDVKYTAIKLGMTKSGVKNQFSGRIPRSSKTSVLDAEAVSI